MIELKAFKTGMVRLGTAFNREIGPDVLDVFGGVLAKRLSTEQWGKAVARALTAESYFPSPAVLLRYGLADGAPQARAIEIYERVVDMFSRGDRVGPTEVQEIFGTAAMEAFVSAGGYRAFKDCEPRDEPFRRKAWVEAWLETTGQEPERAQIPAGSEDKIKYLEEKRFHAPWDPPLRPSPFRGELRRGEDFRQIGAGNGNPDPNE